MFSLCDLRFVVWSLFLDVLRAQRIIVFFLNFPLINEVGKSNHMVGKTVLRSAFSLFFSRYSWSLILWRSIDYFIGAIMERWRIFHVLFRTSLVRCRWFCKVLTKELVHVANRLLPSLCAVRMTSIICMNHSASTFAFIQYPVLCSVEIQCTLRNLSLNSCPLFRHSCECQKSLVFLRIVALVDDEVIIFALGKRSHSSIAIMN